MKPPSGLKKTNPIKACPERSRMGQFQNTTPKEREEKKVSGKLLKIFKFFHKRKIIFHIGQIFV